MGVDEKAQKYYICMYQVPNYLGGSAWFGIEFFEYKFLRSIAFSLKLQICSIQLYHYHLRFMIKLSSKSLTAHTYLY